MVLLCYDGSDDAYEAIARAGPLLADRRAIVLNVYRHAGEAAIPIGGVPVGRPPAEVEEATVDYARETARRGCDIARGAGFDAEPHVVEARGRIADTILHFAAEHDVEAIVVGSRGRGGVRSALLGSVSAGLVHAGELPVIVMPPSDEEGWARR